MDGKPKRGRFAAKFVWDRFIIIGTFIAGTPFDSLRRITTIQRAMAFKLTRMYVLRIITTLREKKIKRLVVVTKRYCFVDEPIRFTYK